MKLLLNYYHPVIIDLAMTFKKLGCDVTISYNVSIKDHYGDWKDLLSKNTVKYPEFKHYPLTAVLQLINLKGFDLIGFDGVFSGDELILAKCKEKNLPWFCINGYPYQTDEPSQNILAFSHFLPQVRYLQKYRGEHGVKEVDWKNIAEKGQSDEKNICVFYPNFWELKDLVYMIKRCEPEDFKNFNWGFGSYIQRFEECNKWNYEVFKQVKQSVNCLVENFEGLPQREIYKKMYHSKATLHLKHADCPGISLFESLICGKPIFTMKSFVDGSFNQDILIDGMTACIADSVEELIERMNDYNSLDNMGGTKFRQHIWDMTDFLRQKRKLETFITRCLNG